jgi:hypothetical protein
MTAESGFTSFEDIIPEQQKLEEEASAKVDSGERMLEAVATTVPQVSEHMFTPIVTVYGYWRSLNWFSRVKSIRGLHMVSSNPEVIFGTLSTGEEIFLSSERRRLGIRRNVFGVIGSDQLNEKEARKLIKNYSAPLKRRTQLMQRGC